jgi:chloramphenicol O-acetyltransferase
MEGIEKEYKMKFKFLKAGLVSLILSVSCLANAGLIQSDYLSSNDNLTVIDNTTDLQWLDLSVSTSWTFANWSTLIEQNNGWRLATNTEAVNLFNTAFPTYSVVHGNAGYVDTQDASLIQNFTDFRSLFGATTMNTNGIDTYGLYKDENNSSKMMGVSRWAGTYRIFSTNFTGSVSEVNNGLYIVRNTTNVPEPSTLAIFALGIMGLAARRFKKQ